MSNSVPSTWAIFSLLDIAPLVPTGVPNFTGEVEYYSTGSVQEDGLSSEGRYTFESRPSRANRWTKPGDVLQARMQGTSKPLLVNAIIADKLFSTGFIQLRPDPRFCNPGFLRHYIASKVFLDDRDSLATGSTQIALTDAGVRKLEIPLAPLNEQRRIAAKLDILLGKVYECQKRLAKISMILKRFRQSVLAAACSGRLTSDWREKKPTVEQAINLIRRIMDERLMRAKNSREKEKIINLYEESKRRSVQNDVKQDLPVTWSFCEVNELGDVCNGSTPSRKHPEYWGGGIPWISSGEIQNNIIKETRETIGKEGYKNSSVRMLPVGTVLLAMIGEGKTRGQTAILDLEATINQNIAAIIISHGLISSKYLWYWFQCQYEFTREIGGGSGPQALNCQRVRELSLNLPPIEEQQEIVRRVEEMFKLADVAEKRVGIATSRTEKLTQAILAKAFRGELVPTEAELARREGRSYETASDLLARIKSERETIKAPTTGHCRRVYKGQPQRL